MIVSGTPKYYFYRGGDNLSGLNTAEQITPQKMQRYLNSNKERTIYVSQKIPELAEFVHYCELSFMISLYQRIYALNVTDCYPIAEEMRACLEKCRAILPKYPWFSPEEHVFLTGIGLL